MTKTSILLLRYSYLEDESNKNFLTPKRIKINNNNLQNYVYEFGINSGYHIIINIGKN